MLYSFVALKRNVIIMCFFLSSRGRHTRYWREWSSDVCSSDLPSDERERRWRHETVPAASFGVVDLAAPAFPAPRTRTVVVEDLLKTEATKKLGLCQVGSRTDRPCPSQAVVEIRAYPSASGAPASRKRPSPRTRCRETKERGSEKGRSWHMMQGRVLWYCDEIGYGFIYPYEGGA